jgi:hypothetical protein
MERKNTTVDKKKIILLLWSMSCMGNKRTQFSVKYDAVCGCDLFCLYCEAQEKQSL